MEKMRGVRSVTQQDELAVIPHLAFDAAEVEPYRGPGQMHGIGDQPVPVQIFGEDGFAQRDRCILSDGIETQPAPGCFRTFDDEGRAVGRELVGVRPDPPRLGLLEGEGESVERLGRAEPDELVGARIDVDPERIGEAVAHAAVDAVRGNDQIIADPSGIVGVALAFEGQCDAQVGRAILQDFEQALAVRRETGDRPGQALTLNDIAQTYAALKQTEKASGAYEEALAIHREMKNRDGKLQPTPI